jgi:protein O-mannosyl-transferase
MRPQNGWMVLRPRLWRWSLEHRSLWLPLLLVVPLLLVYLQVCRFGLVNLDDPEYFAANGHVPAGITWNNIRWSCTTHYGANWFPLTWLSLMLDATLYGMRPGAFHVTNVLLHTANTLLLYKSLAIATRQPLRSAFVAALFALHPLHVESVAWIAERKDVLSTLFGLLSLLAYIRYATEKRRWSYAISLACFCLSLLSKQTLVTWPFVFLLLDLWPLGRVDPRLTTSATCESAFQNEKRTPLVDDARRSFAGAWLRLVPEKLPFLALSGIFSWITLFAQSSAGSVASLSDLPLTERCMNGILVYVAYLGRCLWPHNLAVFYPHPLERVAWSGVAAATAFVVATSLLVLKSFRQHPYLLVGWLWYLGTLVPMIGIIQVGSQQMADRYTYVPAIGLFVAVTWFASDAIANAQRRARTLWPIAIAIVSVLAINTYIQIGYWSNGVTLFRHTLACTRDNPIIRGLLGRALLETGQVEEGLSQLRIAVMMAPAMSLAHYNLALGLQEINQNEGAIYHYRVAVEMDSENWEAHTNLGFLLLDKHKYDEARKHLDRALMLKDNECEPYIDLARLCLETRDFGGAIQYSERALGLDPEAWDCHRFIGVALRGQGRLQESMAQFENILRHDPMDAEARAELERTREEMHSSRSKRGRS